MRPTLVAAVAALSVGTAGRAARAQDSQGLALDRFEPAPSGDAFFGAPSPWTPGHLVPRFTLGFELARDPLVLASGGSVVASQGFLFVDASLALLDRLAVSVDMPFAIVQSGDDPQVGGATVASPSGAQAGDLRLGGRVRVAGAYRDPIQLGLGVYFFVPTAPGQSYAGESAARVEPHVAAGGRVDAGVPIVWTGYAGVHVSAGDSPPALRYGAGAAIELFEIVQIGPEIALATRLSSDEPLRSSVVDLRSSSKTNAELLLGAKARVLGPLVLGVAGGPGLSKAVGTPAMRAVATVGWSPEPAKVSRAAGDADGDGIADDRDACPTVHGVASDDPLKNGCPGPDRDHDGVPDALDACLEVPGVASADPRVAGCPVDGDGDGVIDLDDACPTQKGARNADPKKNGCSAALDADGDGIVEGDACPNDAGVATRDPATNGCPDDGKRDRDGDGVANDADACPNERGLPDPDPKKNGCPKEVRVTQGEIVILKQVQFVFGRSGIADTIDPVSDDLLGEVKLVIEQHPEIVKVEVQGHTDDVGKAQFNATLSQARAESVRQWLISRGVPPEKVVAKGYGASMPVASNATSDGRQKNRRVQFVIVARK